MNKKLLLGSVLTALVCGTMIAGTTYALFTDEANTNIAIEAGNVDINAEIKNLELHSPTSIGADGTIINNTNAATADTFVNGGTATLKGNELTLSKLAPGDNVKFNIVISNKSNIKVQYRTLIKLVEGADLFTGLVVKVGGSIYSGLPQTNDWAHLEVNSADIVIPVEIELPTTAGNQFKGLSTKLSFAVEAVQGNTDTSNAVANVYELSTVGDLQILANMVNVQKDNLQGKTFKLVKDIDLGGIAWTPIGNVENYPTTTFAGTFEGNYHKISNFKAYHAEASGFFGSLIGKVHNLTIADAEITGNHYVGGIAGFSSANVGMEITGCKVINTKLVSTPELVGESYDNGDKVGGIIGYSVTGDLIDGNAVEKVDIKGYRDLGGIAGCTAATVTNNTATDVTIFQDNTNGYKNEIIKTIGEIIGRDEGVTASGNTATNVTLKSDLYIDTVNKVATIENKLGLLMFADQVNNKKNAFDGYVVKLNADIDLAGVDWQPIGQTGATTFNGSFDGQNHTISNLTVKNTDTSANCASGLFGWIENHTGDKYIKNLTISNANITGHHNVGALAGYITSGTDATITIENVHVIDFVVSATNANNDANGDKVGGLIGNATVKGKINGCTAKDGKIDAGRDAGQVVGAAATANVTGCSATNVEVKSNNSGTGANICNEVIGRIL